MKATCNPTLARPSTRSGQRQAMIPRGFTLLELLVVMSLLSIIMIGLVSALRTMAQTEGKIDQKLQRLDEIRVAHTFLKQTLSRVSATTLDAPGATGKTIVPFVATPDSLSWVGIMPARPNVGGRHFFRLEMEDINSRPELVLRFLPWRPDLVFPDWSSADSRILISGMTQLKVQSQGLSPQGRTQTQTWPSGWQNGWPVTDALPEQLRLTLVDAQGEWPDWIVAVRTLILGDNSFSNVTAGGGGIR